MRIIEILSFNSSEESDLIDDSGPPIVRDDDQHTMQRLSAAFTRHGLVKGLWRFNPIEQQPGSAIPTRSPMQSDADISAAPSPIISRDNIFGAIGARAHAEPVQALARKARPPILPIRGNRVVGSGR